MPSFSIRETMHRKKNYFLNCFFKYKSGVVPCIFLDFWEFSLIFAKWKEKPDGIIFILPCTGPDVLISYMISDMFLAIL